jgi:hypothetical protein
VSPRPELALLEQLTADLPRRAELLAAKLDRLAAQPAMDCCKRCLADAGECTGTGGPKPCAWDSVPPVTRWCSFCAEPYGSCESSGGTGGCEGHYDYLALKLDAAGAPSVYFGRSA